MIEIAIFKIKEVWKMESRDTWAERWARRAAAAVGALIVLLTCLIPVVLIVGVVRCVVWMATGL